MSLADTFQDAATHATPEWKPRLDIDATTGKGTLITRPTGGHPDAAEAIRYFGEDPNRYSARLTRVKVWDAQIGGGDTNVLRSAAFELTELISTVPLPALIEASRRKPRPSRAAPTAGRHEVVVISDFQLGKRNEQYGTPELLDVLAGKVAALDEHLKRVKPERIHLFDLGDLIEGDQTGAVSERMLDLSHPEQLDAGATMVYEFANVCEKHAPTEVVAVPSNHTRWRAGKQNLGKPTDDYGLHIHRQVRDRMEGRRITWTFPNEWDESVTVNVNGLNIGATHGHQYGTGGAAKWWAGQIHGGNALARADVLLTGHYHHLTILPTGRNLDGVQKWWVQAPHCEAGSAWFRNSSGESSDGGILTFAVTEPRFDVGSLTIL